MMETHKTSEILEDGYHSLLLGYAAGTLNEAEDLIVASHISLSSKGQNIVRQYENLGGCLIENECEPVEMCEDALDHLLARLDVPEKISKYPEKDQKQTKFAFADHIEIPKTLRQAVDEHCAKQKWNTLYPGLKTMEMSLKCKESKARFLDAKPALKTPHHSHGGTEITLVLHGAFSDETGHYKRGDLIVTDETCHHTPVACPEMGCLCMVVSSSPIKLTGWAKLFNPFIRV